MSTDGAREADLLFSEFRKCVRIAAEGREEEFRRLDPRILEAASTTHGDVNFSGKPFYIDGWEVAIVGTEGKAVYRVGRGVDHALAEQAAILQFIFAHGRVDYVSLKFEDRAFRISH
jgi:hypothetical protein